MNLRKNLLALMSLLLLVVPMAYAGGQQSRSTTNSASSLWQIYSTVCAFVVPVGFFAYMNLRSQMNDLRNKFEDDSKLKQVHIDQHGKRLKAIEDGYNALADDQDALAARVGMLSAFAGQAAKQQIELYDIVAKNEGVVQELARKQGKQLKYSVRRAPQLYQMKKNLLANPYWGGTLEQNEKFNPVPSVSLLEDIPQISQRTQPDTRFAHLAPLIAAPKSQQQNFSGYSTVSVHRFDPQPAFAQAPVVSVPQYQTNPGPEQL